jgi:hypothetical protein
MNEEQQRIWDYLNRNAIGYVNRKSSTEIRDALNLESGGPTNEHVRDMIFNHGCLIGSLMFRKGYWIIQNENELERVINHLNSRADGVRERANILQQNWDNRNE